MKKITILIADDHAVVRSGLQNLLEDETHIEIVGEATDGIEALAQIKKLSPQIVLLDLTMPNMGGLEVAKIMVKQYPQTKSLIFSMHNNQEYMVRAVENGAMGYLLKDTTKEEILKAIQSVSEGNKYFPTAVSSLIIDGLLRQDPQKEANDTRFEKLSKKEKQILDLVSEGMSSKEIAEKLGLSVRTVSNHRANIIKKTKVKNTADLIKKATNNAQI